MRLPGIEPAKVPSPAAKSTHSAARPTKTLRRRIPPPPPNCPAPSTGEVPTSQPAALLAKEFPRRPRIRSMSIPRHRTHISRLPGNRHPNPRQSKAATPQRFHPHRPALPCRQPARSSNSGSAPPFPANCRIAWAACATCEPSSCCRSFSPPPSMPASTRNSQPGRGSWRSAAPPVNQQQKPQIAYVPHTAHSAESSATRRPVMSVRSGKSFASQSVLGSHGHAWQRYRAALHHAMQLSAALNPARRGCSAGPGSECSQAESSEPEARSRSGPKSRRHRRQ